MNNEYLDSSEAIVTIDVTPVAAPMVTNLRVHYGSRWTSVTGLTHFLPWINIDAVAFDFSSEVVVAKSNLRIKGINVATYSTSAFQYVSATRTAVLGLPSALGVRHPSLNPGRYVGVGRSIAVGSKLGGGTDFVATLKVLPGSVNGDGVVDARTPRGSTASSRAI